MALIPSATAYTLSEDAPASVHPPSHYVPFTADPDAAFPVGFLHGFATAAAQIEGSISEDGKGESVYDAFAKIPGNIRDGSSTEPTAAHYKHWREDIALLKELNANAYRFSIAWTRIVPLGGRDDPINEKGLEYYDGIINALIEADITPMATLQHWDIPQTLQERYGGLMDPVEFAKDFSRYADVCFARFGDRVKLWITHNEPQTTTIIGYVLGWLPPAEQSVDKSLLAGHSLILSHGHAVKIYREKYQREQGGQIGITLCGDWGIPADNSAESKSVVDRRWEFLWDIFASPIYLTGDYPTTVKKYYGDRLPTFTPEEQQMLLGSSDFFGYNCYRYMVIRDGSGLESHGNTTGDYLHEGKDYGWPIGENGWRGTPSGVRDLAVYLSRRYGKPLYNTEFGFCRRGENDMTLEESLDDWERTVYIREHTEALKQAIKEGADVRGCMTWTLLDDWEWCFGMLWRFGAVHLNSQTMQRTVKCSGRAMAEYWADQVCQ